MTVIGSAFVDIRAITDHLKSDIRQAVESIKDSVSIKVDADVSSATEKLQALASESIPDQNISVDVDTAEARQEFDDMIDDMESTARRRRPRISPEIRDELARIRLLNLTRTREMRINVKADTSPLIRVGAALARLSGARVVTENVKAMAHEFTNIDKAVPGIARIAVLVGSIGSAAISSVGGIFTLGSALVGIVNMAAIAGPGMAAGFVTGMVTLMIALKDFKNQLPGVVEQYKTLGNTIKQNFWNEARNPIRELAETLFPDFQKGLANTSAALGRWATSVANSAKTALSENGRLRQMFDYLSTSIDNAAAGGGAMTEALVIMGVEGGSVLPRLANWFTEMSIRFRDFIKTSAENGDLMFWINNGIDRLKQLGGVIKNTVGIFNSISAAAKMAGSDGLATILNFVTNLNNQLKQADNIRNMATIFQGANTAASALGDGIGKILGALGNAAPAIKSAFESVGGVVTLLADAISKIISNPEFQAGFTAMFDGIEKGFGALLPVVGQMGPKMGAFLSIIGNLAANIGGILGAALEAVLPLITALKQAIDPLIPILGDALISIIQALSPLFSQLAEIMVAIAPAVSAVVKVVADLIVGLVQTLGPALPGIVAAAVAFFAAFKVVGIIQGVVTAISGLGGVVSALSTALGVARWAMAALSIAMSANPIGLIVAAIAALVAGIIWAYNNVGWFKDAVDAAFKFIGEAVGNVVSFWNTNVVPMFDAALKAAGDFFGGIGKWIGEAVTNVQNFFGGFGKGASDAANGFGDFFTGVNDAIGGFFKGVSDTFNSVVSFISDVIGNIANIIKTGIDIYVGIWMTGFNAIKDFFVNVWNGIVWFFQPIINLFGSIIQGAIDIIVAIWQVGWDIISTIFIGIWTNLVRFFSPIIQSISDVISNTVTFITNAWTMAWQWISDFFVGIWNNMVAFFTPIITAIHDTISNIIQTTVTVWNTAWTAIADWFRFVWDLMVAIYTPIINGIRDTITNVVNGISSTWNVVWGAISNFFSTIWNTISSLVTIHINNVRNVISSTINSISGTWNSVWSSISGFVSQVWSNIVSGVTGFVGDVQRNIQNVLDTIGRLGSDIVGKVGNFGTLLVESGRNLIQGLANGITDMVGFVVDKVKGVGASVVDGLKNFFGIKSPSRLMRDQIGKQLGAGLALGIESSIGLVEKAAANLAEAAIPEMKDIMLPAITPATASTNRTAAAPISRETVSGTTRTATLDANGNPLGSGPVTNVTFQVHPSPGLNEQQIGESAMNTLYWKLTQESVG